MTTAEVNAAIAKAKGWTEVSTTMKQDHHWAVDCGGIPPGKTCVVEALPDFCGDPREWHLLMCEMLEARIDLYFTDDGDLEAFRGCPDDADIFCAVTTWKPSIGESVCRAWLRWKGVSDA